MSDVATGELALGDLAMGDLALGDLALSWHLRRPTPGWAQRLDAQAARMKRCGTPPVRIRQGLAVVLVLTTLVSFCRRHEASTVRRQGLAQGTRQRWARASRRVCARHIRKLLLYVACAMALTVAIASGLVALPKPPPMPTAPPPPVWRDIVKPVRVWSLEAPDYAGAPLDYRARVHLIGGGREDVMTLGRFDGDAPALRLRLFRRAAERSGATSLVDVLGAEAAELGLTLGRSGRASLVETRYGQLETASIRLLRAPVGIGTVCAGFRLTRAHPALSITGLACGRHGARLSRETVGCLVERLDVASARDDRELIDFVAASELKRNAACAGARLRPDTLHAPWLDDKPDAPTPTFVSASGNSATARGGLRRR